MLAVPMIGVLVVSVFQIALLWHAHNIVEAAAQEGSQAAAVINRTCTDGVTTANDMADRLGGAYVNAISVTCQPGPTVTVTVVGQALSMVPGLHFPVRASADAATAGER